ncbi:MAG: toprim domain-containing protein, partial [Clostridia bacterium]|nr:toprim domain-containing protein [Clostridia bacterium]
MKMPEYEDNDEMRKKKYERDRMLSVLKSTSDYYISNLNKVEANKHIDYIKKRGLDNDMVNKFKIGASLDYTSLINHLRKLGFTDKEMLDAGVASKWEDSNNLRDFYGTRLIFPIVNGLGEVVGFSGRDMSNDPLRAKYKNSPQTLVFNKSQLIYGYNFLRELKKSKMLDTIVLVEGQMDVIACHQAGVTSAIGVMGTALTPNHARDLAYLCKNIILCLDGDGAGETATYKAINTLKQANMNVSVVRLTKAKDPDEYIKKFGKDAFVDELFNAMDCIEFILIDLAKKYDLNKNSDKNKYINEALEYLSKLSTSSEQEIYLSVLKEIVKVPVDALRNTLHGSREEIRRVETIEETELKANAFEPLAKICVLASMLYNKISEPYKYEDLFEVADEYKDIYNYLSDKINNKQDINISTIYSCFDIEKDSVWDKVINYKFPADEVFNSYLQDCVVRLRISKLKIKKQTLKINLASINDFEQKYQILAEMKSIDEQIAQLEKEVK